ncbi:MAG: DUF3108 domain-containing protein [Candidatus Omnitrophota bacterium]
MRQCLVGGLFLLFICGCVELPRIDMMKSLDTKSRAVIDPQLLVITSPDRKLPEYEVLTFEVRWFGMRVGNLTTSVRGMKNYKGRDVYVLEATMKTTPFFSKIYKVDDRFVSYMDAENLYTLRHEVYRRDGSYCKDAITEFDQLNHKAYFKNLLDKSEKTFDIPEGVHDILSACYYFMLLPVNLSDTVEYYVCNNEQNYHFSGLIESKARIRLPVFGKTAKEAFLIQPYARLKGKKVDKGRVMAYFSCDKRRIPLVAVVKGPVFTEVTISLAKIETKSP